MFAAIACSELRQQLRSHVFWVVSVISLLMTFGSVSIDPLRVGLDDTGLRNGAAAIARTHLVWTLFFMFTTAAFVADAVLRDDDVGFAPIVRTAPITRTEYVYGRFAGAFGAVLLCFLSVPLGLWLGTLAPWVDASTTGPILPGAYGFALAILALPNLLLGSAIGFGLAILFRALSGALLGAVALLTAYGLGTGGAAIPSALEPFGFAAYEQTVAGWPISRRDAATPALAGPLLHNRLIWTGVALAVVILAGCGPRRAIRVRSRDRARPAADVPAPRACATPAIRVRPSAGRQFLARTRLELGQLVWAPAFGVLALLGLTNAAATLVSAGDAGAPLGTEAAAAALSRAFRFIPIVVALFFAGELMWNERARRMDSLVGATPLSATGLVLPKLLVLILALISLALGGALVAAVVQAVRGGPVELGRLLWLHAAHASFDWALFATLAVFLQAVAKSKLAGWGWLVLFLIASLAAERLGYVDPLYRYGRYPGWPLAPALTGAEHVALYRSYWLIVASGLAGLAVLMTARRRDA